MSAFDFTFSKIDGTELPLSGFRGRAVLLVNTASECGFTPQYAALQKLWERYRERGLVVLGVPSNDFGAQEPGNETEVIEFCRTNYGVDFPLTTKQAVIGASAHPFFRWLEEEYGEALPPRWNFHKYLIGPDGELRGAWPSKVDPLAEEIIASVEEVLPA